MFDDFPIVNNYGKLSAQFHVSRSRLGEMVGFMWAVKKFPAQTIVIICLKSV